MKRTGIVSFGLLLDQPELLKSHLLVYDELWVPFFRSSYPDEQTIKEWDLDEAQLASIAYLHSEGFIAEPPFDPAGSSFSSDDVTVALIELYQTAQEAGARTYPTARQAALEGAAASFNIDIALSRLISYVLWRDKEEVAYPVVFPFGELETVPESLAATQKVLSIVLKRFPIPSPDVSLEDLVAFKRDGNTQYQFDKFWHWTQKMSRASVNKRELEEEIDWLVTDYSHQLKQLSKEQTYERLEVLVATPLEMLEDLVKIRWGKLARGIFALGRKKLSAHNAELKLPGSELAYITEASRALTQRYYKR